MNMTSKKSKFLNDVISTAVEVGCGYWAEVREAPLSNPQRPQFRPDADKVGETDAERLRWKTLFPEKLHEAICKVLDGRAEADGIAAQFIGYPHNTDKISYDAAGADAVVQVALFGEVLYG